MPILLSFVLCSRNDGYPEGNGINLLNFATNELIEKLAKIKFKFEIVIVEYNPPLNRKPLIQCIKFKKYSNVEIRIITVKEEFHSKLKILKNFRYVKS